jgi:hypothetical protein
MQIFENYGMKQTVFSRRHAQYARTLHLIYPFRTKRTITPRGFAPFVNIYFPIGTKQMLLKAIAFLAMKKKTTESLLRS